MLYNFEFKTFSQDSANFFCFFLNIKRVGSKIKFGFKSILNMCNPESVSNFLADFNVSRTTY